MDFIKFAIHKPVAVSVGVILVILFGLIGLGAIPIQLTPTVDRPIVTVTTTWPGRSPQEIVDEITKEQEQRLKNVTNLKSMRSTSREGAAEITLEFYIGTDISRALQDTSDALRQVPSYPEEVDEPVIKSSEGAAESAIAWIIIDLDPARKDAHPGYDVSTLFTAMDREVRPFLERIDGVAEVNIYGGREKEVRILLDPTALALRRLSVQQVLDAIRAENRNTSAGTIAEGKRDYRIRVIGQYASEAEILDTVIAYREAARGEADAAAAAPGGRIPIFVRDVGTVEIGHQKARGFVRSLGEPCLAMNVIRQSGANVMKVMADLRVKLDEVRRDILPRLDPAVGPDLRLRQVYDETDYIRAAIRLVRDNLWEGGTLAVIVLLFFLRSIKSTAVIALSIPISVIATFLVMLAVGRTLNVISLAGLAFSTGMVVDDSIVVLENIDRRRALGDSPLLAIYRGAKEVWTAVLASTGTTVAVFIPLITIREEVGQLFFDLTLALAVSVALSMVVAIFVVPAASAVLFRRAQRRRREMSEWTRRGRDLFGLVPWLGKRLDVFERLMYWLITGWRAWTVRPALILALTAASLIGSFLLMPPIDYLPAGNQNLVFGGLLIPPGLSVEQMTAYAERIERQVEPYMKADIRDPASVAALPPIFRFDDPRHPYAPVPINNFFIGAFNGGMFVGGTSQDPQVVLPLGALLTSVMNTIPASFGGASQSSIFGRGIGGSNNVNLEISGPKLDRVVDAAGQMVRSAGAAYGFGRVRPAPANFNLPQPEWRLRLTDAGRELGLTTRDLGVAARGLFDGAYAGDYILDGRKIDIVVLPAGGRLEYKEQLATIPVATPSGRIVPLDSVAEIVPANAAQEISRIEELPSVTVGITPPPGRALEDVMKEIREKIVAPAMAAGMIDPSMRVRLEGTAAKLDEVRTSLFGRAGSEAAQQAAGWQRWLQFAAAGLAAAGAGVALWGVLRSIRAAAGGSRRHAASFAYAAAGALALGLILGGVLFGFASSPHLLTARFVWALLVTFLLMAALFESFLYPFVIMFSVPLAVVGGFGALRIVHEWTLATPTIAPQQLDVLTMVGFVILIGTVVKNAILLVEQALNFMEPSRVPGFEDQEPLPPLLAIAASVRSRIRPIFMTMMTTLGGGLPLVIAPGAGSEMYRGLGAVVCGGLLVSTVFTLVLVPLAFSLAVEMAEGLRLLFAHPDDPHTGPRSKADGTRRGEPAAAEAQPGRPAVQPAAV